MAQEMRKTRRVKKPQDHQQNGRIKKERKVGMMNKKTVVERKKVASKHKKERLLSDL